MVEMTDCEPDISHLLSFVPDETWFSIIEYAAQDQQTAYNIARTCKYFNRIVQDKKIWTDRFTEWRFDQNRVFSEALFLFDHYNDREGLVIRFTEDETSRIKTIIDHLSKITFKKILLVIDRECSNLIIYGRDHAQICDFRAFFHKRIYGMRENQLVLIDIDVFMNHLQTINKMTLIMMNDHITLIERAPFGTSRHVIMSDDGECYDDMTSFEIEDMNQGSVGIDKNILATFVKKVSIDIAYLHLQVVGVGKNFHHSTLTFHMTEDKGQKNRQNLSMEIMVPNYGNVQDSVYSCYRRYLLRVFQCMNDPTLEMGSVKLRIRETNMVLHQQFNNRDVIQFMLSAI